MNSFNFIIQGQEITVIAWNIKKAEQIASNIESILKPQYDIDYDTNFTIDDIPF